MISNLQNLNINTFMFLIFGVICSPNYAVADVSSKNTIAKADLNGLSSFQINCANGDDGEQQESKPQLTETIIKLIASDKSEQRISALSQLAVKNLIDEAATQKILQAALSDKDPDVRAQAVYAIAQQQCDDAHLVLEQALQDNALPVRLMAIDSLGDNEKNINLLERALEDEEDAVKELAAMKLEFLISASRIRNSILD